MKKYISLLLFAQIYAVAAMSQNIESLSGIATINDCSGSIITFEDTNPSAAAYVMTNGHCLGKFPAYGTAIYNLPQTLGLDAFDGNNGIVELETDVLIFATMSETDIAIYRLKKTVKELRDLNVNVFKLAEQPIDIGHTVHVSSGYWEKNWSCRLEEKIFHLKEGQWSFFDSLALGGPDCSMVDGASGSPLVSTETGHIVGIWNTWNETGGRCKSEEPCEMDRSGAITVKPQRRYGQQVWKIHTCLDSKKEFDPQVEGCLLKFKPNEALMKALRQDEFEE